MVFEDGIEQVIIPLYDECEGEDWGKSGFYLTHMIFKYNPIIVSQ